MHIFFVLSQVYQFVSMNQDPSSVSSRNSKRPEQYVRFILLTIFAVLSGGLIFLFLDSLQNLMQNPIFLTFIFLILASLLFVFFDRSMRIIAQTYFNGMVRNITSWFVTIDPIEVLENYIVELRENTAKMNRQMHRLNSQMHVLQEEIVENKREIRKLRDKITETPEPRDDSEFTLWVRKAGRLEDSTTKLSNLLERMKNVYRGLSKMKKHSHDLSVDLADQLELKRKERNAIQTSHSAMEVALELLDDKKGASTEFNEALEDIADDVSRKVGEMEHYMKLSDEFLKTMDLKKGVLEDTGMKKLEDWQNKLQESTKFELKQPLPSIREKQLSNRKESDDSSSKE